MSIFAVPQRRPAARFNDHELRELERIIEESQPTILEAWNGHFGN
jgi:hypothetical protein